MNKSQAKKGLVHDDKNLNTRKLFALGCNDKSYTTKLYKCRKSIILNSVTTTLDK